MGHTSVVYNSTNKYMRVTDAATRAKVYVPYLHVNRRIRGLRRVFRTAGEAILYRGAVEARVRRAGLNLREIK